MKKSLFALICMTLNACAVLSNVDLIQTVCIDSNVTAFIYVNDKNIGKTPFCGKIERGLYTSVVLKANGYKTTEVPLQKGIHRQYLATSNTRDLLLATGVNIASLSVPTGMDMTYTSQGRWIEYMPDSYYVEMYSPDKRADLNDLKIKAFALKNFYPLKSGDTEYMAALSALTNLPVSEIFKTTQHKNTPAEFAHSIFRQTKRDKK